MPTKTYYLNEARTETLTATWSLFFRRFEALYNGQSLGEVTSADELRRGHRFALPDGRTLSAQLVRNQGMQELELLLENEPVPGSGTHPLERIKQAWYALLLVGVLNAVLGLVAVFMESAALRNLGLGWPSLAEGLIFLGLGWYGTTRRSAPALYAAFGLLVLDGVLVLAAAVGPGGGSGFGGIFLRFALCVLVLRGAKAAQARRDSSVAAMR